MRGDIVLRVFAMLRKVSVDGIAILVTFDEFSPLWHNVNNEKDISQIFSFGASIFIL